MTPEEKVVLDRVLKLTEENNEILRAMRRSNRLTNIMRVFYWVIILVVGFGSFYFIQPYVNMLIGLVGGGTNSATLNTTQNQINLIQDLLK